MNNITRYKVIIEYDGSYFYGWQRQRNISSVQQTIEEAIYSLTGENILVEGAGRTDTGVHATGQVAHFDLKKQFLPYRLQDGLNHYLREKNIIILKVEQVDHFFHARFSAISRTYHYKIINRRAPCALERKRVWHIVKPLDIDLMHQAAQKLIGHHDFSAFRAAECQAKTPLKTMINFTVSHKDETIIAVIKARSFLHNQVRIMMGSLKMVGLKEWSLEKFEDVFKQKNRTLAGPTAPPHGLYLVDVGY